MKCVFSLRAFVMSVVMIAATLPLAKASVPSDPPPPPDLPYEAPAATYEVGLAGCGGAAHGGAARGEWLRPRRLAAGLLRGIAGGGRIAGKVFKARPARRVLGAIFRRD